MFFEFLVPIEDKVVEFVNSLSSQTIGKKIALHTCDEFPNLDNISIVLITVNEYRGAELENDTNSFNDFRKYFYALYPGNWKFSLADLGTIEAGASLEDTYFLVKSICEELHRKNIFPIIVGGTQDLTYPMYRAYDNLDQMVNLVSVDSKFDFAKENGLPFNSYLSSIVVEEPNNLFNFANLGYQTYFNSQ